MPTITLFLYRTLYLAKRMCVGSREEPRKRNLENMTVLPYRDFLEALCSGEYSS
jgi:hypothetical protein